MKKSLLFVAAAAMFVFAGCNKEQLAQELKSNNVIHIGVKQIAPATKVAADDIAANKLSFKWEEGDQVSFTDNDNYERIIIYTCTDPATGEFSGEALDPDATYWVEYPNGYSGTFIYRGNQIPKGHLIMNEEVSGSATTFTLDTHETIIHFKLKGAAKVGSIALSYGDEDDYTLSCGDGVQLSDTATDFYMDAMYMDPHKLSSIAYTLSIYDTNNKELKSVSFHLKEENQETIVDFATPIEVNAAPSIPEGALPGVFSVSATEKVYFSQGNLYCNTSEGEPETYVFKFEENQYDFYHDDWEEEKEKHVSYFYWTDIASQSPQSPMPEKGNLCFLFTNQSGNTPKTMPETFVVNEEEGWRTLSKAEWDFLLNARPDNYNQIVELSYTPFIKSPARISGEEYYGLFIYPDNYKGTKAAGEDESLDTWEELNNLGIVFLPLTEISGTEDLENGWMYWTSELYGEIETPEPPEEPLTASYVFLNNEGGTLFPRIGGDEEIDQMALPIRLVKDYGEEE